MLEGKGGLLLCGHGVWFPPLFIDRAIGLVQRAPMTVVNTICSELAYRIT